jgi:hypothetical protein
MIGAIAVGLLVWYLVLAFRRAYGGTAARAVLRAAVVSAFYLIAVGLAIAAMIAPVISALFS